MKEKQINERELPNQYPIHAGYLYVMNGKVMRSPFTISAGELKERCGFDSIKNCDIGGRNLWHLAV